MKFVAISDTHGCHRQLDLPTGDVLLHAGDVCDRGDRRQADDFFRWFGDLDFDHKLLIWGNHDFDIASDQLLFPSPLPDGVVVLDCRSYEVHTDATDSDGARTVRIYGVPTPADKRAEPWDSIPSGIDVVVTHRPPKGLRDISRIRGSQGSQRLNEHIARAAPAIHVFGHIHHGYGRQHRDGTHFVNAALYRSSRKTLVNAPVVFDIVFDGDRKSVRFID